MSLNINVGKSKVLVVRKANRASIEKVKVNEDGQQVVVNFKYLGVKISKDWGM